MDPLLIDTENKYQLIKSARNLRKQFNIPPSAQIVFVIAPNPGKSDFLEEEAESIMSSANASDLAIRKDFQPDRPMPSEITALGTLYMELNREFVDHEKEKNRLQRKIDDLSGVIQRAGKKLNNEKFVNNAPPEVVSKEKEKYETLQKDLTQLQETLIFFE